MQGAVRFAAGQAGEASTILLEAARAFEPIDARTAREALLEAFEAALSAGWTPRQAALADVARTARAIPGPSDAGASATDLLLEGFAARVATGYTAGVPLLRRAIAKLRAGELSAEEGLRRLRLGCLAAEELWDDQAQHALATRCVQLARDSGAPMILAVALSELCAVAEVSAGRLDAARACIAEGREIPAATANPGMAGTASGAEMFELAWRGREQDARRLAAAAASQSARADRGSRDIFTQHGLAVLELGLGNYQAALRSALAVYDADAPPAGTRVLPDLVEAAARTGETELAHAAVARLADRALAAGTELALGLLARSRALLADDGDAENLYAGGHRAPEAVHRGAPARPRPSGIRRMAAPSAPPPRRARAVAHRARHVRLDRRRGVRRTGPGRAAGHRRTRPPADGRDPGRAHRAGGADSAAGQPGREQS